MAEAKGKGLAIFKNKKLRPWLIGGVVLVGGIVIFVMMKRGGGGDTGGAAVAGGPSEGLQMAQLQAAAASQQVSAQQNVALAQIAAESESYRYGQDTSLAMAQLDAQTAQYAALSQTQISLAGIEAQSRISEAQERTAQLGINVQGQVQSAGIQAQTTIAQAQYAYLSEQSRGMNEVELARINQSAKTARSGQKTNLIGGIIGGVLGLFSDVRMKKEIVWEGEADARNPGGRGFTSYGRYSWTYMGDYSGKRYTGVIAQEVARVAPMTTMVSRQNSHMAVAYGALPA